MATYYIRKTGSDSNNGTSPATAWATFGKVLQNATAVTGGDTIYVGPGVYREVISVSITSWTSEVKFIGDVDGTKTGDTPGEVRLTAYLTNDKTAPSASVLLALQTRDFMTFENITFVAGANYVINANGNNALNFTFRNCLFIGQINQNLTMINGPTATFGTALNWLFERCIFIHANGGGIAGFTASTAASGSDYDINVVFRNCFMLCLGGGVTVSASGTDVSKGNGVHLIGCTIWTGGTAINANSVNLSNTVPNKVRNCLIVGSGAAFRAAATGGLIQENYNRVIDASTAHVNVTPGANTVFNTSYSLLAHFGQEWLWSFRPRPFLSPTADSPLLAFGDDGVLFPTDDFLKATRPAGGASALKAVGAFERGNTFGKETSTVRTGSNALSITGPGYQDFELPVDNVATTVSVYVRWDATYAGTKPKLQVLNGSEAGVADATDTATGSSGSWEQLELSFTPTSKGIVTLRVLSSDTNGGGKMFVDDFAVT